MSLSGEQIVTISVAGFASLTSIIVVLIQCRKERRLAFEKESVRVFGIVFSKIMEMSTHYELTKEYLEKLTESMAFVWSNSYYLNNDLQKAALNSLIILSNECRKNVKKFDHHKLDDDLQVFQSYMEEHYFFAENSKRRQIRK